MASCRRVRCRRCRACAGRAGRPLHPPLDAPADRAASAFARALRAAATMSASRPSPMALALAEAERAGERGEVPIGAVLVDADGNVLAGAGNRTEERADPTAHAELLVLREAAAKRGRPRLEDCDLYVTLEPCAMCAAAISFARLRRLYFGAGDPKGGA